MPRELDWSNLAMWLQISRGAMTQAELAAATGVGKSTIEKYENERATKGSRVLRQLASYFWTPTSLDRVLQGGRPEFRPGRQPAEWDEMSLRSAVEPFDMDPEDREIANALLDGDAKLTDRQRARLLSLLERESAPRKV